MMSKEQKKSYVEEMKKVFSSNEAIMIAHYKGLNVKELDKIRNEMRENGIFFKITKNRITKLALKETKCKDLEKFLSKPKKNLPLGWRKQIFETIKKEANDYFLS